VSSILILGAGGHAKVVAETCLVAGVSANIAFLDDRPLDSLLGWPVIGPLELSLEPSIKNQFSSAIVAIGQSTTRLRLLHLLHAAGYQLPLLIHPSASISSSAQIGAGSVVFAQAAVQAHVQIGIGAILNTGCSVDHDSHLADGVHICPGSRIAGSVQIGARSCIGIGASIIQHVRIGSNVTVGAGAAVVTDLPDDVTAVGVPARVLFKS
jgi:sugar O-acyltransferase (sialic acid O-acetyltransferase NeuD family)